VEIFKISEDSKSYTLGWNKPPGENAGYRFREEGLAKVPHTWDTERNQVRVEKGHTSYTIEALSVVDTGVWSPVATSSEFGVGLFGVMSFRATLKALISWANIFRD